MHRTADSIEETKAAKGRSVKAPRCKLGTNPNSLKNLIAPWPKGVSANPGGLPGTDVAAVLARQVISANKELAYKGLAAALCKGNAYVFKELAERGYGKLKEVKEVTHRYANVPDTDLDKRLTELIRDLGLAQQIDEAGTAGDPGRAEKTNGAEKVAPVLP